MSYENEPASMKQRILFMSGILGVMAIILYFVLNAEGIAPKKDIKPPVVHSVDDKINGVALKNEPNVNPNTNYNDRSVYT